MLLHLLLNYTHCDDYKNLILTLIRASTDLQENVYFHNSMYIKNDVLLGNGSKKYFYSISPFHYQLYMDYNYLSSGENEKVLKLMLSNNYSLWNDVKNNKIDLTNLTSDQAQSFNKRIFNNLGVSKLFESLNTLQLILLASKNETNVFHLPADIIMQIINVILIHFRL